MDYLKVFEQIERAYRNQPDMKQEFAYDELTCIKKYIQQLYHCEDKRERILLFDKYRAAAACIPEGTKEAEKMDFTCFEVLLLQHILSLLVGKINVQIYKIVVLLISIRICIKI